MTRTDTTPRELLSWILEKLKTDLGLTDATCFLSISDWAPARIPSAPAFVTVTPLDGEFHSVEQVPGNVLEHWAFRVRVYVRISRDRAGQDVHRLLDSQDGLIAWKQKILKSLCGQDLGGANLGQTVAARQSHAPQWVQKDDSGLHYVTFAIDFVMPFGWDLE